MKKNTNTAYNARILIIDDQLLNIRLLESALEHDGYTCIRTTRDSREALSLYHEFQPDMILLDWHMPHFNGQEVLEQLQEAIGENYIPIIVLTADTTPKVRQIALSSGATDFLTKPFQVTEVLLRVRNLLQIRNSHARLQQQNHSWQDELHERTRRLEESQIEILARLGHAAECRDDDTGEHTQRVGLLAAKLGEALGMSSEQIETLRRAAPLHDVGKIAIPDSILLKPGKLTDEEFSIIKSHAVAGARLLQNGHSQLVKMAEIIALTHHEKWDGSGYPLGLKGEEIPLVGRIVALADVFDALTHERPYKRAWTLEEATSEITKQRGRHFDPAVVDAFLTLIEQDYAFEIIPAPRQKADDVSLCRAWQSQESGGVAHTPGSLIDLGPLKQDLHAIL